MDTQSFLTEYSGKSDQELVRLTLDREALTQEALVALDQEMKNRGLHNTLRFKALEADEEERRTEIRNDPGRLFMFRGIGRARFGKANYSLDPTSQVETFDTTVFIVFLLIPLIPTGTFRISRAKEFLSDEFTVLERLPLDWEQVLRIWIVTGCIILAVMWGLRLFVR